MRMVVLKGVQYSLDRDKRRFVFVGVSHPTKNFYSSWEVDVDEAMTLFWNDDSHFLSEDLNRDNFVGADFGVALNPFLRRLYIVRLPKPDDSMGSRLAMNFELLILSWEVYYFLMILARFRAIVSLDTTDEYEAWFLCI